MIFLAVLRDVNSMLFLFGFSFFWLFSFFLPKSYIIGSYFFFVLIPVILMLLDLPSTSKLCRYVRCLVVLLLASDSFVLSSNTSSFVFVVLVLGPGEESYQNMRSELSYWSSDFWIEVTSLVYIWLNSSSLNAFLLTRVFIFYALRCLIRALEPSESSYWPSVILRSFSQAR